MSRPSTSHQPDSYASGSKRPLYDDTRYQDPNYVGLPSNDTNSWYYPSHGRDLDDDEETVQFSAVAGNWGRKNIMDARWVRKGKLAPWGPGYEDWEIEEHAKKRLKLLLPTIPNDDEPITLPHLRSSTPPLTSPYPTPNSQHLTYSSFMLDKGVTQAFRSKMLDELEQTTNTVIEGEGALKRALGRLWQALSEDPDRIIGDCGVVPKREDADMEDEDERDRRVARAPDLTPTTHKLFLTQYPDPSDNYDHSTEAQTIHLEKSLAVLRDFQDDGREYVERLEEIRDGLGDIRRQRDAIWDIIREKTVQELRDAAVASAVPLG